MLIALFIGLGIAGLWGLADIASSHVTLGTTRSTVVAQGSGMLLLLLCGMLFPMGGIDLRVRSLSATLLILMGLGCIGGLGYLSLYRAFQTTLPVGLVSALVAGSNVISTLLSWLVFHDVSLVSVLLLLCGVVLLAGSAASDSPSQKESQVLWASFTSPVLQGIVWAMAAALCMGVFNFGLGLSSSITGAWYVLLLGSRAISLLLLSFVLAGSQDDRKVLSSCWRNNLFLAVGVGVAEMLGLMLLSSATELSLSHLTLILALASCSVLLPLCYSISQGMHLSPVYVFSLILILFGLVTLKEVQATSLSTAILVVLVGALVVWKCVSTHSPLSKWSTCPIPLAPACFLAISSLKETIMSTSHTTLFSQSSASASDESFVSASQDRTDEVDQERPTPPGGARSRRVRSGLVPLCALLSLLSIILFPAILTPDLAHAQLQLASVGALTFTSSGQMDPANTTGFDDGVTLSLHSIPNPAPGTSYFVWLQPDQQAGEAPSLLVGTVSSVPSGNVSLSFTSPTHQNLLAQYSSILLTQQASNPAPLVPSQDHAQWRDLGVIPRTPSPNDPRHYSLLDHLRHLLASDPTLMANGLAGGLSIWLYRDAQKVLEWSTAARDSWTGNQSQQSDLIHRHLLR